MTREGGGSIRFRLLAGHRMGVHRTWGENVTESTPWPGAACSLRCAPMWAFSTRGERDGIKGIARIRV